MLCLGHTERALQGDDRADYKGGTVATKPIRVAQLVTDDPGTGATSNGSTGA
jgi:hypothetical protein